MDEAHAVLDAVRAARALPGTSLTAASRVALFGYSQGGGHRGGRRTPVRLRPRRTPLRHLLGGAARDLTEVTKAIDGSDLAGSLGWSVNGFLQSDPALRPIADAHLNSAGRAALDDLSTMCVGDALFTYNSARSTAWTTDGETISDVIAAEPALHAFLDEQRIGTMRPSGPVRLATGTSDDLVPHAQARRLAVDWCRLGGNVTYKPVILPDAGRSLINHFAPLLTDQGDAIAWLTDRLNGKPVASARGLLPMQP